MSNSQKHDFKHASEILSQIHSIDNKLKQIIDDESKYEQEVRNFAEAMRHETISTTLKNIDIEQTNANKNGIRVSLLKSAGIHNIQQVLDMPYGRLIAINGIGNQTASKIRDAANSIYNNVERTVRLRIDPENRTSNASNLVQFIYILHKSSSIRVDSHRLYDENHSSINEKARNAKIAQSRLRWMFSFRNKKDKALACLSDLEVLLSGDLKASADVINSEFTQIVIDSTHSSWTDFEANSALYYAMLESIAGSKLDKGVTHGGLSDSLVEMVEAYPLDLSLMKTTLRGYQLFGTKYILCQKNVLLGDEMGLGKTVQSIAAMANLKAKGMTHFVVVCPTSVLINWSREVVQHSTLNVFNVHGKDRDNTFSMWVDDGGIAVTTYGTISKLDMPKDLKIDMLVADEAHYVKNPYAIRTQSLLELSKISESTLFMTGTPLENRVEEMHFLVKCLQPKIATEIYGMGHILNAPHFREKVAPVYLRRIREDVLTELPELVEKEEWCRFNKQEIDAYRESVFLGNFMAMRQLSWNITDVKSSTKANRLLEICEDAKMNNRKIVIFSYFREVIGKVCTLLGEQCMEPITGSISSQRRQEIIDEFTKAAPGTVLICQVIAGGVGLNIQAASVVVFCEPQIKPSIENQAISRAYRMGQIHNVVVHRLLVENSIDERIMDLLSMKQDIFDNFAHESVVAEENKKMSEKTWMNSVIQEEQERFGVVQVS
ncbi:MAG: DEAD/DEAH box helicase [Methanococcoides sp.]|nr:DEAD/DEAH box helicase [Methanococcoides sp.]